MTTTDSETMEERLEKYLSRKLSTAGGSDCGTTNAMSRLRPMLREHMSAFTKSEVARAVEEERERIRIKSWDASHLFSAFYSLPFSEDAKASELRSVFYRDLDRIVSGGGK